MACSPTPLILINESVEYLSSSFEIGADLDFSNTTFTPIGSYDTADTASAVPFTGTLSGGGHTISNVNNTQPNSTSATGLFSYTSGATISNLSLSSINFSSYNYSGILVGYSKNTNFSYLNIDGSIEPAIDFANNNVGGISGNSNYDDNTRNYSVNNIHLNVTIDASHGGNTIDGLIRI